MRADLPKGPRPRIDGAPHESVPFEESTIVPEQRTRSSSLRGARDIFFRLVCGQEKKWRASRGRVSRRSEWPSSHEDTKRTLPMEALSWADLALFVGLGSGSDFGSLLWQA